MCKNENCHIGFDFDASGARVCRMCGRLAKRFASDADLRLWLSDLLYALWAGYGDSLGADDKVLPAHILRGLGL